MNNGIEKMEQREKGIVGRRGHHTRLLIIDKYRMNILVIIL